MNLHNRTIEAHGLYFYAYQLFALQLCEQPIQHPALGPAIHARVDGMPVAKALRQRAPLTSVLGDIQNCVDDLQIRLRHVASLTRQILLDSTELGGCDFHALSISDSVNRP